MEWEIDGATNILCEEDVDVDVVGWSVRRRFAFVTSDV